MKQLDLFGGDAGEVNIKRPKKQVFSDYDSFIAKFNAKAPKTTDDCYTPQPVYDAVLNWLKGQVDIEGRSIVRPFYPGGDYKNEEYSEDCVVVDNPPSSILAEIVRFYITRKIDFFLFAPGLTLFSSSSSLCTAIVADAQITYHNNAVVKTGFLSSLFPGVAIMVSTTLHDAIADAMRLKNNVHIKSVGYPVNVVSSALLNKAVGGGDFIVLKSECEYVRTLDAQRAYNKSIFGNGYLLSTNAAKAYVEAVAKAREKNDDRSPETWKLSPRELKIIEKLDAESCKNDNCT